MKTSRALALIGIFTGSLFAWLHINLSPVSVADDPAYAQGASFNDKKIVPFVPTPQEVVDKMIELAAVKNGDTVYDLGSGDGRIVIAAAKKGARAVGFHSFDMGDWKPAKTERIDGRTIYLWVIPAKEH